MHKARFGFLYGTKAIQGYRYILKIRHQNIFKIPLKDIKQSKN